MAAPNTSPKCRPVVLVVNDEAEMREVLRLGLEVSFDVELARSANEAELEHIK
jgi:hypothetical protein